MLSNDQKVKIDEILNSKNERKVFNRTWELTGWPTNNDQSNNISIGLSYEQALAIFEVLGLSIEELDNNNFKQTCYTDEYLKRKRLNNVGEK